MRVAVEPRRARHQPVADQPLLDSKIIAFRRFGLEGRIAIVRCVKLIERRRLEAFGIACAQRRARLQPQRGIGAEADMAAIDIMIVVAHAGAQRQRLHRIDDRLAIFARHPGREMVAAVEHPAVLMLDPGDQPHDAQRIIALIFIAFGAAAVEEDRHIAHARIEIVAIDVGDRHRDAVAEPSIGEIGMNAGIAIGFLRLGIFAIVGEHVIGRRIAVEIDPAMGVIAAQIEPDPRRQRNIQPPGAADLIVAIALGALVIGGDAVGRQPPRGQRAVDAIVSARDSAAAIGGAERPAFELRMALEAVGRLLGHDIDNAADRLTAPRHRIGSAQHLDALDRAGEQIGEIEPARRRRGIVDPHPVDQHQRLRRFGAADVQAGQRAEPAAARYGNARRGRQQIRKRHRLALLDRVAIDHGDRLADIAGILRHAGGGDDDVVGGRCFLRECGARRDRGGRKQQ